MVALRLREIFSTVKVGKGKRNSSVHDFPQFTAEATGTKKSLLTERLRRKKNYLHLHYEFPEQICVLDV